MTRTVEHLCACNNRLGEAPVWLAEHNALLWIDLPTCTLFRFNAENAAVESQVLPLPSPLGAIVRTADDASILVTHHNGIARLHLPTGSLTPFADPEQGRDAVMYNDAKVDQAGRLWAGTSHVTESEARGCLWIVDGTGRSQLVDAGFAVSNGPAFSPDGRIAYFSDSATRHVFTYDMEAPGAAPRNRRLFCRFEEADGVPDGLTVDTDGCIWIAHWAGARISKWSPSGERLEEIAIPAHHVTSVCFGGPDLRDLYVTSAWDGMSDAARQDTPRSGDLFRVMTGSRGLPEPRIRLM